jgi:FMN phosphatase YigB (HAD superfamily)
MNPFTLHQSALIRQVYTQLGRAGEAEDRVRRWYALRDSFAPQHSQPELRVREVKQYARSRIYSEVLDGDPDAARLFEGGEARGFSPAKGVGRALAMLREREIPVSIVSESSSLESTLAILRFLRAQSLIDSILDVVTPAGRFGIDGNLEDTKFVGKTKREGTIYDQLEVHLRGLGIATKQAAIVGDDPVFDIANANSRGFLTIQYVGIVNRGVSPYADYVIDDWSRLPAP